jgi:phenylpropionate dioxygenase-like ring-hydroxylating dioxygenase large terminal subunit
MRSILSAADYTSPEVFVDEERQLFRRLWIVAGFRSLLDAPDAFITHRIGGVPVVLQNTPSGLRAFVNQCAHRQSALQLEDFGRRRLACPYHGWVYDDDGRVKSIPRHDTQYGFPQGIRTAPGLRPIALRTVGGLLLVNLADDPMPLEEQFSAEFLARLEHATGHVGGDAMLARFEGSYNWKLNFENVNDWNHVPFVHVRSFASMMTSMRIDEPTAAPASPPVPDDDLGDDLRELSHFAVSPFAAQPWPWHEAIEACAGTSDYLSFYLYPNVNYVVLSGVVHLIQQFCPISPERTEMRLTMALGRRKKRLPAAAAILWTALRDEKRVIDEDVVVLEGLQRGLSDETPRALHGAREQKLRTIARIYRRLMEEA